MKLRILAIGTKMPAWVASGYSEYQKRMPHELRLEMVELAMASRAKSSSVERAVATESALLDKAAGNDFRVALDVKGKSWSTEQLAEQLLNWQSLGRNVSLLIGGPDGMSNELTQGADQRWSLSPLTLPHPIVRIVLAEQLYRAWTVNNNHPYHRS